MVWIRAYSVGPSGKVEGEKRREGKGREEKGREGKSREEKERETPNSVCKRVWLQRMFGMVLGCSIK